VTLVQGVFVLTDDKGRLRPKFVPVTTGITGTTDIEVLSGLKAGDKIVTGRYKILRTLKSGVAVKEDNSVAAVTPTDDSSS
jgi:HlyD family secretion protein